MTYSPDQLPQPTKKGMMELALYNTPLLHKMPQQLQQKLLELASIRKMQKKEILFMEGDEVKNLYWIHEGKMKEYYCNCQGEECLRQIIGERNFTSLHKLFDGTDEYSYTCEALSPTLYAYWPKREFLRLADTWPQLATRILAILAEYMEIHYRQTCLCRKPVTAARIAGYLLSRNQEIDTYQFLSQGRQKCPRRTNIRPIGLTAAHLCLSRETFSRSLSTLQEKGVITLRRGVVEIIDMAALKELSGLSNVE